MLTRGDATSPRNHAVPPYADGSTTIVPHGPRRLTSPWPPTSERPAIGRMAIDRMKESEHMGADR